MEQTVEFAWSVPPHRKLPAVSVIKRASDVLVAGLQLVGLAPVFPLVVAAMRFTSRGAAQRYSYRTALGTGHPGSGCTSTAT